MIALAMGEVVRAIKFDIYRTGRPTKLNAGRCAGQAARLFGSALGSGGHTSGVSSIEH
jgi:hypothetical protein